MAFSISPDAEKYGFVFDKLGAHLARTIMVNELSLLLTSCDQSADKEDYRNAVIKENVLLKKTSGSRKETYNRLNQLYGLSQSIFVFTVLRELWKYTSNGKSILALLCALARDPILRSSVDIIINSIEGEIITSKSFEAIVQESFPDRLKVKTLASVGRNLASSWTQSGHLQNDTKKVRRQIIADPISVVYALLLAHVSGFRGDALFGSPWVILLDTPTHTLREYAQQASQKGWMEYRYSGQVTDITFRHFMEKTRE